MYISQWNSSSRPFPIFTELSSWNSIIVDYFNPVLPNSFIPPLYGFLSTTLGAWQWYVIQMPE
jgi:hypothetical protein